MGATLKYGEFDFGPTKVQVKAYARGGSVKKACPCMKAKGGAVKADMDKAVVKEAVHKHERVQHPGEPLTKLRKGGQVTPSREAMVKRETKETPRMQREEVLQRAKVISPARRSVPVAPTAPLLAMKCGGKVR